MFLGYWWFFRYNSSPWLKDSNCLPVLSVGEITCHDHEGDWEGITVVLERRDGALHPAAGVYDAHGTAVALGVGRTRAARPPPRGLRRGRQPCVVSAAVRTRGVRSAPARQGPRRGRLRRAGGEWPFNADRACDRFTLGGQRGRALRDARPLPYGAALDARRAARRSRHPRHRRGSPRGPVERVLGLVGARPLGRRRPGLRTGRRAALAEPADAVSPAALLAGWFTRRPRWLPAGEEGWGPRARSGEVTASAAPPPLRGDEPRPAVTCWRRFSPDYGQVIG